MFTLCRPWNKDLNGTENIEVYKLSGREKHFNHAHLKPTVQQTANKIEAGKVRTTKLRKTSLVMKLFSYRAPLYSHLLNLCSNFCISFKPSLNH